MDHKNKDFTIDSLHINRIQKDSKFKPWWVNSVFNNEPIENFLEETMVNTASLHKANQAMRDFVLRLVHPRFVVNVDSDEIIENDLNENVLVECISHFTKLLQERLKERDEDD